MRLLLDTHVVLWWGEGDVLPAGVKRQLVDPSNEVLLSAVVTWEVAIKTAVGKLQPNERFRQEVAAFGFVSLPVTSDHAWGVRDLPLHHHDPFDRLLVAQARAEGATLVSADERLHEYDVPVLWS